METAPALVNLEIKPSMNIEMLASLQQGDTVDESFFDDETQQRLANARDIVADNSVTNEILLQLARDQIKKCDAALLFAQTRTSRENPQYSPSVDIALCQEEMAHLMNRSVGLEQGTDRQAVFSA